MGGFCVATAEGEGLDVGEENGIFRGGSFGGCICREGGEKEEEEEGFGKAEGVESHYSGRWVSSPELGARWLAVIGLSEVVLEFLGQIEEVKGPRGFVA